MAHFQLGSSRRTRPISLLRIALLRFVDSKFAGEIPLDMRIPPLRMNIMLESNPPNSRILVRRLAVLCPAAHPSQPAG